MGHYGQSMAHRDLLHSLAALPALCMVGRSKLDKQRVEMLDHYIALSLQMLCSL